MSMLKLKDAEIYYEEYGKGYPVLLFAPGGMRSRTELWQAPTDGPPRAWNDWTEALAENYHVIAMDQRNAGRSHGTSPSKSGRRSVECRLLRVKQTWICVALTSEFSHKRTQGRLSTPATRFGKPARTVR
ncbi:MAG: alpha/beta hydrolase [Alphaproteobacteria bacterium]|nr:alpha/beta hydrolase [Alphaproteobacteria bacterium]